MLSRYHPHRRYKCPVCHALPGKPCYEMDARERTLFGPYQRNGVSHVDRVRPPHAIHVFWDQWDLMPGLFGPIRFFKAVRMTSRYYTELDATS